MAEKNQVRYDVDGYEAVTTALLALVNQFPGLEEGEEIAFSSLGEDGGIALYPVTGAVIESEKTNVCGEVTQVCAYPFTVVYRASGLPENRKAAVKEWLDDLGRWLERRPVTLSGTAHRLESYPPLTEGRKVLSISRQTPAFLSETYENKSEDWVISISARYENQFER